MFISENTITYSRARMRLKGYVFNFHTNVKVSSNITEPTTDSHQINQISLKTHLHFQHMPEQKHTHYSLIRVSDCMNVDDEHEAVGKKITVLKL